MNEQSLKAYLTNAEKYNNTDDLLETVYNIKSSERFNAIILAPSWVPEKVFQNTDNVLITCTSNHTYFSSYIITIEDIKIMWIKTAAGACNLVDAFITTAKSNCDQYIFLGAVGGLTKDVMLGDICTSLKSLSYDGASMFLNTIISSENLGTFVEPYCHEYIDKILFKLKEENINVRARPIFCTDSLLCEYSHLDFIHNTGCELIEMETASFNRCLNMSGKKGIALLCVSDNSASDIALAGRKSCQSDKYHNSILENIPKAIEIICRN